MQFRQLLLVQLFPNCTQIRAITCTNCLHQCIAKSFTQKLPLGKESGYTVPEFCDAYAICDTCPQEGATHFSGHISTCTGTSISIVLVSVGLRFARSMKKS